MLFDDLLGRAQAVTVADKRVLLVDDELLTCRALERCLVQLGYEVLAARSAGEARALFDGWRAHPCRYALVDQSLGNDRGIDLIADLSPLVPRPAISIFSGAMDSSLAVAIVRRGAIPMGRPSNHDDLRQLFSLLDACTHWQQNRCDPPTPGKIASDARIEFRPFALTGYELETPDGARRLRRAEARILLCLAQRQGHCTTTDHLAWDVLGRADTGARHSVHAHIANLRENLGPYACVIQSVTGLGYRYSPEALYEATKAPDTTKPRAANHVLAVAMAADDRNA